MIVALRAPPFANTHYCIQWAAPPTPSRTTLISILSTYGCYSVPHKAGEVLYTLAAKRGHFPACARFLIFGLTLAPTTREPKVAESLVDHGTLPERTYERLRDLIIRGRIPPGGRVREAEMAMRFGVSRTPIREALARLVQEGYLAPLSAGRRTELAVTALTPEAVRELWGMIGALEGHAIQAVTELPQLARAQLAEDLTAVNAQLSATAERRPRDQDRVFELQTAFHVRFVYHVAGPHLRAVYDSIRPHVQRYEWAYGTRSEAAYTPSTNEHLRIVNAIRRGDPVEAKAAIESHWKKAAGRTMRVILALSRKHPRAARHARDR